MMKESALNSMMVRAKAGDETAIEQLKEWQKNHKQASHRVEELRMRLLQLTERHWEQSISILKGWLNRD